MQIRTLHNTFIIFCTEQWSEGRNLSAPTALLKHICGCLSMYVRSVLLLLMRQCTAHFVMWELRGQPLEQTLWIKFICLAQRVSVCSCSGSKIVPLFLCVRTSERDRAFCEWSLYISSLCTIAETLLYLKTGLYDCTPKVLMKEPVNQFWCGSVQRW